MYLIFNCLFFSLKYLSKYEREDDTTVSEKQVNSSHSMFTYRHIAFPICLISMLTLSFICIIVNGLVHQRRHNTGSYEMEKPGIDKQ